MQLQNNSSVIMLDIGPDSSMTPLKEMENNIYCIIFINSSSWHIKCDYSSQISFPVELHVMKTKYYIPSSISSTSCQFYTMVWLEFAQSSPDCV